MGDSADECKDPFATALNTIHIDHRRVLLNRAHAIVYSCALLALFYHHSLSLLHHDNSNNNNFVTLFLLLVSDVILAFMWVVTQAFRWRPVRRREEEFAPRLGEELPALDVFICTADPHKEPPESVVGTALSAMAFEYPPEKLSVYVSDDGGSQLTLFAFMEAARFARYWLPFCREHHLVDRCPDAYFTSGAAAAGGRHSEKLKVMYQRMKKKIQSVVERGHVDDALVISEEEIEALKTWTDGFTRQEHPTVIQVLLESNKDVDITDNPMPNLVYLSREKSRASPHHFKAGALNALIRVSGAMTNAPVILTLDCDMYSNDPETPLRAMCYLHDDHHHGGKVGSSSSSSSGTTVAFVQFPQRFRGINESDIYASEMKRLIQIHTLGMDGLRGPNYLGTNCFFTRRCFYGTSCTSSSSSSVLSPSVLSPGLDVRTTVPAASAASARRSISSEVVLRKAHQLASCSYEHGTKWGHSMGTRYGSLVEDYNTGYHLHCEGWGSVFCDPERPAFLGGVAITLNDALSQNKRWCVGLLEVAFSKYCPLTYGCKRASLAMGMCYAHYAFWASWSLPITAYAVLPQIALFYGVPLFPKASDPWFYLYAYLFLAAYAQDLIDFLSARGTFRMWWNDQRMWMIRGVTSYLFGFTEFLLQCIGVTAVGFNVTSKVVDDEQSQRYDKGVFDFGVDSPFFVSLGTIAVMNLVSFAVGLGRIILRRGGLDDAFLVQVLLSGFGVVNCWPVYEAMVVRSDGGRIPGKVTRMSLLLAGVIYWAAFFMF